MGVTRRGIVGFGESLQPARRAGIGV
ncbi:hypothetical protein, partial [Pseudomonas aeruginosa]